MEDKRKELVSETDMAMFMITADRGKINTPEDLSGIVGPVSIRKPSTREGPPEAPARSSLKTTAFGRDSNNEHKDRDRNERSSPDRDLEETGGLTFQEEVQRALGKRTSIRKDARNDEGTRNPSEREDHRQDHDSSDHDSSRRTEREERRDGPKRESSSGSGSGSRSDSGPGKSEARFPPEDFHSVVTDEVETRREKQMLLHELEKFRQTGTVMSKAYTIDDDIGDIKFEFEYHKRNRGTRSIVSAILEAMKFLFFFIENANRKYGPFVHLDNWAADLTADMTKFDEPVERLYLQYFGKRGASNPWLQLGVIIFGSMAAHHINYTFSGKSSSTDQKNTGMGSISSMMMGPKPGPPANPNLNPTVPKFGSGHMAMPAVPQHQMQQRQAPNVVPVPTGSDGAPTRSRSTLSRPRIPDGRHAEIPPFA